MVNDDCRLAAVRTPTCARLDSSVRADATRGFGPDATPVLFPSYGCRQPYISAAVGFNLSLHSRSVAVGNDRDASQLLTDVVF